MEIELPFGDSTCRLRFSDQLLQSRLIVDQFIPKNCSHPVQFVRFKERFFKVGGADLLSHRAPLVVVNDGHRRTPTATVLTWLDRLDPTFLDRALFLIATGAHPPPDNRDLESIFGDHLSRLADRVSVHSAFDSASLSTIGTDSLGEQIRINRGILNADEVLFISSVEPHYFAGFTGGRKSIMPGLSDFASIERNHNLANSLDAAPLKLKGNPVAEHLAEPLSMINADRFLSVQLVVDSKQEISALHCGKITDSFEAAVEDARIAWASEFAEQYDAVVCEIGEPLNRTLYQAQKGLENCRAAVKNGGSLILLCTCSDGIGPDHFYRLAESWNVENNCPGDGQQKFGSHKLSRVLAMSRMFDIRIKSLLDDEVVERVFYHSVNNVDDYLNERISTTTGVFRLAVVRDAANMVLYSSRKP